MSEHGADASGVRFGSFITPSASAPGRVVDLAVASEHAGLDLVTFQDHPYQPGFLDTWTLLSWVAARTERITVAPDVASLPLRPPAVLARAVASLDLLSGGRVELGLGAGAFWDAIVAMGGRRLAPGESVDALSEAVDVIRGIWDADERSRLSVDGTHHRVVGAKRGPAPAHPVGIWLGAYKPRMLRLVGRKADGWLPSLSYLASLQDLDDGHRRIDDAAAEAGRDPADIRRLLNVGGELTEDRSGRMLVGPPAQWAEQIAGLALEHRVDTVVVAADDERTLAVLGQEVVPGVRELVAAERRG